QLRYGTDLLFPVFDTLTGSGSNAEYHIIGWVGFHLLSDVNGGGSSGSITGYFTQVIWDGIQSSTGSSSPDFGVHSIELVNQKEAPMTYRIRNVAIAIGLALVAMLLTLFYVVNYRRTVQHSQATVQVYVAAHNIAAGTAGTEIAHGHALKVASVPRRSVVPGAISDPNQVASLVLTQPLYTGEQVTLRRFSDVKAEGVIGQLKGNQRAVQVPGDPTQILAGTLKAGDHVDLVANLSVDAT